MLFVHVSGELGVWMGVGCSCPPVRNDILTPCHLLSSVLAALKDGLSVGLSVGRKVGFLLIPSSVAGGGGE